MKHLIPVAIIGIFLVGAGCETYEQLPQTTAVSQTTTPASSKESALKGREFFSAFQCSIWAYQMGNNVESDRIFKVGYEKGGQFLTALHANQISEEDYKNNVPIGVTLSLSGPTNDFILGSVYESVASDTLGENNDAMDSTNKFLAGNCSLIK